MNFIKNIIIFIGAILLSSCCIQRNLDISKNSTEVESAKIKTYIGWWVYGEGQYIFKDEQTLKEYNLEFPNENMKELKELYLAVCEMEYFPMDCAMTGHLKNDVLKKQTTLVVANFEILYIQGCE